MHGISKGNSIHVHTYENITFSFILSFFCILFLQYIFASKSVYKYRKTYIMCIYIYIYSSFTLPKFNSSPLKMDGWKTTFLLGFANFSGGELLNFGRVPIFICFQAVLQYFRVSPINHPWIHRFQVPDPIPSICSGNGSVFWDRICGYAFLQVGGVFVMASQPTPP